MSDVSNIIKSAKENLEKQFESFHSDFSRTTGIKRQKDSPRLIFRCSTFKNKRARRWKLKVKWPASWNWRKHRQALIENRLAQSSKVRTPKVNHEKRPWTRWPQKRAKQLRTQIHKSLDKSFKPFRSRNGGRKHLQEMLAAIRQRWAFSLVHHDLRSSILRKMLEKDVYTRQSFQFSNQQRYFWSHLSNLWATF